MPRSLRRLAWLAAFLLAVVVTTSVVSAQQSPMNQQPAPFTGQFGDSHFAGTYKLDVNHQDGEVFPAGSVQTWIWALENPSDQWPEGVRLRLVWIESAPPQEYANLILIGEENAPIPANQVGNIQLTFTVPQTPGNYKVIYVPMAPDGRIPSYPTNRAPTLSINFNVQ